MLDRLVRSKPSPPPVIDALLLLGAFGAWAVFHGPNVQWLALGYGFLLMWALRRLWRAYEAGFEWRPYSAQSLALLYCAWLAITLAWTPVAFISETWFWWLAVMPLVFLLATSTQQEAALGRYLVPVIGLFGLSLAAFGAYQLAQGQIPQGPFLDHNLFATTLNLIAIVVGARYLEVRGRRLSLHAVALGAIVFLLLYVSMATQGRGPLLTVAFGALVLAVGAWRQVPRRALLELLCIGLVAFVAVNTAWHDAVVERLATIAAPQAAGASRFVIWRRSWAMLMDHPWFGVGLGMYPLLWPPYRDPSDASAGYFVHNDYLNLWIEAGLPALILFVATGLVLAWQLVRALRNAEVSPAAKVEIAGLLGALATVAAHSLLEFNFYIITTLLLCGLMMARAVALAPAPRRRFAFVPARYLGRPAYRLVVLLVLLFPGLYFARIGIASFETDRGLALAKRGEWDAAAQTMTRAMHLWPESDAIRMSLADLYRYLVAANTKATTAEREQGYKRALALLDAAIRLDPLRAQNYGVRAELVRQNPQFAGGDARAQALAAADYARAIRLDPLYVFARTRYADLLWRQGAYGKARQVLEAGLAYSYPSNRALIPYYALAARARAREGDAAGARALLKRIEAIEGGVPPTVDAHHAMPDP